MDKTDKVALWLGIAIVSLMIFGIPTSVWIKSHFEAASYRKFCDTPVTTWDAIWLDLRIDEC